MHNEIPETGVKMNEILIDAVSFSSSSFQSGMHFFAMPRDSERVILGVTLLATMVVTLLTSEAAGQLPEKNCKTFVVDLTKELLTLTAKCARAMKFKNGKEKQAKAMCPFKCTFITYGVLAPPGLYDEALYEKFKREKIPRNLYDRLDWMFHTCEKHSEILDPNEEYCKTYEPLTKCVISAATKVCDPILPPLPTKEVVNSTSTMITSKSTKMKEVAENPQKSSKI